MPQRRTRNICQHRGADAVGGTPAGRGVPGPPRRGGRRRRRTESRGPRGPQVRRGPAAKARRPSREAGPPRSSPGLRPALSPGPPSIALRERRPVTSGLLLPERPQRQSAPGGGGERGTFWKRPLEGAPALPYPRSGRRRGRGEARSAPRLAPAEKAAPQVPSSRASSRLLLKGTACLSCNGRRLHKAPLKHA